MCKKCECFSLNSYQNSVSHRALQAKLCLSLSCGLAGAFERECRARLLSGALQRGGLCSNGTSEIKQPFRMELFRAANPETGKALCNSDWHVLCSAAQNSCYCGDRLF